MSWNQLRCKQLNDVSHRGRSNAICTEECLKRKSSIGNEKWMLHTRHLIIRAYRFFLFASNHCKIWVSLFVWKRIDSNEKTDCLLSSFIKNSNNLRIIYIMKRKNARITCITVNNPWRARSLSLLPHLVLSHLLHITPPPPPNLVSSNYLEKLRLRQLQK